MRLAVFTNQYPGRVNTFFVRDLAGLAACGVEIDVFPLYPEDPSLWMYAGEGAGADANHPIRRERVHYGSGSWLPRLGGGASGPRGTGFGAEARRAVAESLRHGVVTTAKTAYAAAKARRAGPSTVRALRPGPGYWGNYAATAASLFARRRDWASRSRSSCMRDRPLPRPSVPAAEAAGGAHDPGLLGIQPRVPPGALPRHRRDAGTQDLHVHQHGLDFSELPYMREDRARRDRGGRRVREAKGFDDLLGPAASCVSAASPSRSSSSGTGRGAGAPRAGVGARAGGSGALPGWLPFRRGPRRDSPAPRSGASLDPGLGDGAPNVIKEGDGPGARRSRRPGSPGFRGSWRTEAAGCWSRRATPPRWPTRCGRCSSSPPCGTRSRSVRAARPRRASTSGATGAGSPMRWASPHPERPRASADEDTALTSWVSVYHRLPGPLREAGASLHGYRLRSWHGRDGSADRRHAREGPLGRGAGDRWLMTGCRGCARRRSVPYYRRLWERGAPPEIASRPKARTGQSSPRARSRRSARVPGRRLRPADPARAHERDGRTP